MLSSSSRARSTLSWPLTRRCTPRTTTAPSCAGTASATARPWGQKALRIGLVLVHARVVAAMIRLCPLVMIDEVAAYLDARRRTNLYDALEVLQGQVWMTGADPALFAELAGRADVFYVEP